MIWNYGVIITQYGVETRAIDGGEVSGLPRLAKPALATCQQLDGTFRPPEDLESSRPPSRTKHQKLSMEWS